MTKGIDKIYELIIEEALARKDFTAQLSILMICLEVLDRFHATISSVGLPICPTEHLDSEGEIL